MGTFLYPPKIGERITRQDSMVICFDQRDAMAMANTGFFTQSCQTVSGDMQLIAESVERVFSGEGDVWMVGTRFNDREAWIPIPWHDWG